MIYANETFYDKYIYMKVLFLKLLKLISVKP